MTQVVLNYLAVALGSGFLVWAYFWLSRPPSWETTPVEVLVNPAPLPKTAKRARTSPSKPPLSYIKLAQVFIDAPTVVFKTTGFAQYHGLQLKKAHGVLSTLCKRGIIMRVGGPRSGEYMLSPTLTLVTTERQEGIDGASEIRL